MPIQVANLALKYKSYNTKIGDVIKLIAKEYNRIIYNPKMTLMDDDKLADFRNQLVNSFYDSLNKIPQDYIRVARSYLMNEYVQHFNEIAGRSFSRLFGERNQHLILQPERFICIKRKQKRRW